MCLPANINEKTKLKCAALMLPGTNSSHCSSIFSMVSALMSLPSLEAGQLRRVDLVEENLSPPTSRMTALLGSLTFLSFLLLYSRLRSSPSLCWSGSAGDDILEIPEMFISNVFSACHVNNNQINLLISLFSCIILNLTNICLVNILGWIQRNMCHHSYKMQSIEKIRNFSIKLLIFS